MVLVIISRERSLTLLDLFMLIEAGVPGYDVTQWQGVLITAGTPAAIPARLQREIARAVKQPEVAAHFANDGSTAVASTPTEFRAALDAERKKWGAVIRRAGIKAN